MVATTGPGGAVGATTPTTGGSTSGSGNTTTTTASPPAGVDPTTPDSVAASHVINDFFAQFGLQSLATWAWQAYLNGSPIDQVMIDAQKRPEWKARFPAMDALAQQGRAMTPAQYIDYETQAVQLFQAYGLPKGFYDDPSDFTAMMVANVARPELESRLKIASQAAFSAPQEVRDTLSRLYGITDAQGALTAYWLDPDRTLPLLESQFTSAQIAAQAQTTKFGNLNRAEAERLAALGVTDDSAKQGFQQLNQLGQVLTEVLPGEDAISKEQALGAAFAGDAVAQKAIQDRQGRRVAAFGAGGGFTGSQSGKTGIGTQE